MTSQMLHVFLLGLTRTFSPTRLIFAAPSPLHYPMRLSNAFFTSARDRTKRPVPGSNGSRSTVRALKKNLCHKPSLTVREQCHCGQWIDVLPRLHFSA